MSYHHHLNYFQPSPVRGQLEPEEPANLRTGWRFIQCTDTPNQLKVRPFLSLTQCIPATRSLCRVQVLLPPRTATLYAHLLKLEGAELARGSEAQWQRVMEIRHLKDRMIRKCQRIAQPGQQMQAADVTFRTVYAPPDFRLKEMERYLKGQEPRPKTSSKGGHGHSHHRHQAEHSPPPQASFSPESPPSPEPPRHSSIARSHSPIPFSEAFPNPHEHAPEFPEPEPAVAFPERPPTPPMKEPVADIATYTTMHDSPLSNGYEENQYMDERTFSPDPIPVPFRASRALDTLHEHPEEHAILTDEGTPLPLDAEPLVQPPQRPIVRRRSSLKRSNSSNRLSASGGVAFAMDFSRTEMVAREVEIAGQISAGLKVVEILTTSLPELELLDLRDAYRAQLTDIQQGRLDIADQLQRLHLQEEALRSQEQRLNETYRALDEKEAQYRNKGAWQISGVPTILAEPRSKSWRW